MENEIENTVEGEMQEDSVVVVKSKKKTHRVRIMDKMNKAKVFDYVFKITAALTLISSAVLAVSLLL